jgi:hypothetical protein
MSQTLERFSVSAPGFYGLNTQDSPLDLAAGFALTATNCVIDQFGRIGARKGWTRVNSASGTLGANNIGVIHELVQADGSVTVLFAGNNKLFKLDGSNAVVELTYGGGGTAPTITENNWQCASLNGITYFFQIGYTPLAYDPALSTTTYRRVSEHPSSGGTPPSADICISAYGRLWVANTATDKQTITFSDLLLGYKYTGGSAGTLNINQVWPNGADEITGLAAHNGFLFIFGKRQILVYQGATNPSTMSLYDTVGGIGCIARDSIQNTNTDVVFLSNSGVRSILRTIQEKSAPFRDLSKNVRNDLMQLALGETPANIKAVYSEVDAFYLITFPTARQAYVFDTRNVMQDGSSRVTTWTQIEPTALYARRNGDLLIGKNGYVGKYNGYLDYTSTYRLSYYTNHADLGDESITSIIKRISAVLIGGSNQTITIKWAYDFSGNYLSENISIPTQTVAEYGANGSPKAQYGLSEYSNGVVVQTVNAQASGSGKIVQTGYEAQINGFELSIQKIEVLAKRGRIS